MRVIIKSISLLNFKGVRDFTADFNADITEFRGENGTGKTTLNDAFSWLLYGKDSMGRSDFQIKTLDSDNNVIEKLYAKYMPARKSGRSLAERQKKNSLVMRQNASGMTFQSSRQSTNRRSRRSATKTHSV